MVLVTGATGILGRVIVLELLKRGKSVRATKRVTSNLEEVRRSFQFYVEIPNGFFDKIEWINIDFEDQGSLENALQGIEEVYHCAAIVSFHPDKAKEMYHTNIEGTKQLLYACENTSVKKFLHISSIAVLDGLNEKGEKDENSNYNPKLNHSPYAVSKHFAEMEVWRASAEGLNTIILNPGIIIGSGNWQQSSGEIFKTFEYSRFNASGGTAYVDVRDVAKIAVQLMEKEVFGERFIVVSENKSFEDIGNRIREQLGLSKMAILKDFVLNFAKPLRIFGFLFPTLKMINKTNIEAITSHERFSNQKIKKKLNYDFIPVEESLDFHLKNYILDKN